MSRFSFPGLVALVMLVANPVSAQLTIVDFAPGNSTGNVQFAGNLSPNEVIGGSERVNNYINDTSPIIPSGATNFTGPDIFGVLQTGVPATDALTPAFNITFIRQDQNQMRFGIRDANAADHASKNVSTLVWIDDSDFANPISSAADLVSGNASAFVRGEGTNFALEMRLAILDGTQWYLSESNFNNGGAGVNDVESLSVTDFANENWGAFTPATSSSNAFVSSSAVSYNTASSSLNNIQGLGYFIQSLNDEIDPGAETRHYGAGFSYLIDAPATEYVTDIPITSNALLGANGVQINSLNSAGAVLTRNSGSDLDAANMSSNETWNFTLSNVDLDGDGQTNDSLTFDVALTSTFAGSPARFLHDRTNLPAGDFNTDGNIDGADFLLWQRGGSPDPNSPEDLADWQGNYGEPAVASAGGGIGVEQADVGDNEGGLSQDETLQFVASNLTYSLDGGPDQNDGTINGFRLVEMVNNINQDNVDVNGTSYGLAGSSTVNLGLATNPDITVQFAPGTIPIGGMNPQMVEKTQDFAIGGVTLRVTIPAGVPATGAVPEPSSIGLALLGLSALAMRRRAA